MPIYEYECPLCGVFEVMQKASDKPLKAKPDCDNKKCPKAAHRLISQSAFHLKGGGWYKTDYAKSDSGTGSKKGTAKSKDADKTETSKDSAAKDSTTSSDTTKGEKKSLKVKNGGGCGGGCSCH